MQTIEHLSQKGGVCHDEISLKNIDIVWHTPFVRGVHHVKASSKRLAGCASRDALCSACFAGGIGFSTAGCGMQARTMSPP